MKLKLAFFPSFADKNLLSEYVYRASWYLFPFRDEIHEVTFYFNSAINVAALPAPPDELAPNLKEIAQSFHCLKIVNAISEEKLVESVVGADFIFVHDEGSSDFIFKTLPTDDHGRVKRVDKDLVRFADSFFLRFSEHFPALRESNKELAKARAGALLPPLRRGKSYLFGTGPNLSNIEGSEFSDGVTIACNSMAINGAILDQIQPDLFVIADPIFHAGPSAYAFSFRTALIEQLRTRSCPLIVPMRDFHIYRSFLPDDLQDRMIPVDFEASDEPILDVVSHATVTTTSNILTLFQIPLAATLTSEIFISGCDGRPTNSNDYFWKHNKSVQINDEMESIKRAHPAFFDISYEEYYSQHIETLERWISACEAAGIAVYNLTPSYIPALQSRQIQKLLPTIKSRPKSSPKVSIVIPSFNSTLYLRDAVESLLNENRDDLEIIIIDDFSEDGSFDLAAELAESYPCIRVFQNYETKGVSGARNTGLALARGAYIGFLDADDLITPGSLNARVAYLDAHDDANIVHSRSMLINDKNEDLGVYISIARDLSFLDMSGSGAHFNTVMIRSEVLGSHLKFDTELANGEDWLALSQLLRRGERSHYVPDGTARYRVHSESTVLKDFHAHERTISSVIDRVYSREQSAGIAAEFETGLSQPPKEEVIYTRRVSNLLFFILNGDVEQIRQILSDQDFRQRLSVDSRDFSSVARIPAVRFSALPIDRQTEIIPSARDKVVAGISAARDFPETGGILECIADLYGLNDYQGETFIAGATGLKHSADARSRIIIGPYARGQAHWDETRCIWKLFGDTLNGSMMIDVGAHFGSSMLPFLNNGWEVFAFEPDVKNRTRLLERVREHRFKDRLSLDIRCVSNEPSRGVSFFTSEVSTGISGLSAFHGSHEESQTVDVTTLTLFFEDREMRPVDFLKIDTEGHDLFVLEGYPWSRGRPAIIECEFEDSKTVPLGYTFHDLAGFLSEKGYVVYVSEWHPIIQYGIQHDWRQLRRYPCELESPEGWGNLLAFRDPLDEASLLSAIESVLKVEPSYASAPGPQGPSPEFVDANIKVRTGNFSSALPVYLRLYERQPLDIYAFGAIYSARKMGITVAGMDELRKVLKQHKL